MDKPNQISRLLHSTGFTAERVLQRGQYLQRLDQLLGKLLDSESKLHCQVGNIRDGMLILYTDSTAWATRLRYQTPALLQQLQQQQGLEGLRQIELRILPDQEKLVTNQKVKIGKNASSCLSSCADSIADEALSSALRRLASRHDRED